MTRAHRSLFVLFFLGIAPHLSSAQVTTGIPPFGSFGGGPDVINLANLNSHLSIPVLNKPGRGMNFTYDLSYDSSIWYPVTSGGTTTWTPVWNWGWAGQTQITSGYVDYHYTQGGCNIGTRTDPYIVTYNVYSFWNYHDQFGTTHPIGATVSDNGGQCPNGSQAPSSTTVILNDGSGYKIYVDTTPTATVYPSVGGSFNPPLQTGIGSTTATDRNGNSIAVSNGIYTDTLGTTALTVTGTAPSNTTFTYSYTKPDGTTGTKAYTIVYTTQSVQTKFGCGVTDYGPTSVSLISEIDLPDGSKYTFTYEPTANVTGKVTGRIASITFPTGSIILYTYLGGDSTHNGINCSDGSASGLTRQTPDGSWTYARTQVSGSHWQTTVGDPTTPTSNQALIDFQGIYETQRQVYQGPLSGTLLQTINTCYNSSASPCTGTAVTLPIARRTATVQLNSGPQYALDVLFNGFGLPTEIDEFDYGTLNGQTGPLIRQTTVIYASLGNNINASQQTITVLDGQSHAASQTTYNYDETAVTATAGTPQHTNVTGSRGNATTVKYLVQGTTYLSKTYSYYDTGNVKIATDFAGAQTTYTYGACGNSFPTQQVTSSGSLSLSNSTAWDCNGGLLSSTTDTNSKTTNYKYDSMLRLTNLQRPDGVNLTYQYPTATTPTYVVTTPIQGTLAAVSTTTLDGLGRPIRNATSDTSQNTYSIVDTQYDVLGRPYKFSNPYTSGTRYWSTTQFDALGRVLSQTQQDGGQTTYAYAGKTTTVTDPALKQRKYDYDALGRIVNAWEPDPSNNNSLTLQSSYVYTANDQISGVTQGVQSRSYTYDLMGRLTSVITPESGQVTFQYNSAGLLSQKIDARGVTTNYVYDGLSRLTGHNYTIPQGNTSATMPNVCDPAGNPTPTQNVCYYYDQGGTAAYALGRLTKIVDTSGSETYTFNQLGRTTQVNKTVGSTTYSTQYQFNLANQPTTVTYPSGRIVQNTYDAVGRLCAIGASGSTCSSGTTYASSLTYNPVGQLTNVTYGNGVTGTFGFSADRLQLTSIGYAKGAQTLVGLNYWYKQDSTNCINGVNGNNGQIQCATDTVDSGRNASYTYDGLYRLISASTTGSIAYPKWHLTWAYDRYGNRLNQTVQSDTSPNLQPPAPYNLLSFANPGGAQTNRQDNMCFDANGNLLAETAPPCPSSTYVYDAENRLVSYQSATYSYDAKGIRVKKQSGTATTVYIFSGSRVIAEYDNGTGVNSPSREYIYSGTALLAKIEGGITNYFHNDRLSARLLTDSSGNTLGQRGDYPFGETWYETGTTTKWKFTTYERDTESTNDYALARSFVNRFGRFTSPDLLSGGVDNPQSLNRYAYAQNDPCNRIDPLGLASTCKLNVKLNSGNGVTLSDADKAAIANRINSLLASTQMPNGDTVQIQTSYSGDTDYSLNFTNAGDNKLEAELALGGQLTLGDAPIGGANGNVYPDAIRLASAMATGFRGNSMSQQMLQGGVAAHELVHMSGQFRDEKYNILNVNTMMQDTAPTAELNKAMTDPDNALWKLTPPQIEAMYKDCITRHGVPKPPARTADAEYGGDGTLGGGYVFDYSYTLGYAFGENGFVTWIISFDPGGWPMAGCSGPRCYKL